MSFYFDYDGNSCRAILPENLINDSSPVLKDLEMKRFFQSQLKFENKVSDFAMILSQPSLMNT